jgi:hypothetical protein
LGKFAGMIDLIDSNATNKIRRENKIPPIRTDFLVVFK